MINIIQENNLVEHTAKVGDYMYQALEALQSDEKIKDKLINLRGKGYVFHPSLPPTEYH
jgi:4-aminobutyrate aminotransferase-like enzyme